MNAVLAVLIPSILTAPPTVQILETKTPAVLLTAVELHSIPGVPPTVHFLLVRIHAAPARRIPSVKTVPLTALDLKPQILVANQTVILNPSTPGALKTVTGTQVQIPVASVRRTPCTLTVPLSAPKTLRTPGVLLIVTETPST